MELEEIKKLTDEEIRKLIDDGKYLDIVHIIAPHQKPGKGLKPLYNKVQKIGREQVPAPSGITEKFPDLDPEDFTIDRYSQDNKDFDNMNYAFQYKGKALHKWMLDKARDYDWFDDFLKSKYDFPEYESAKEKFGDKAEEFLKATRDNGVSIYDPDVPHDTESALKYTKDYSDRTEIAHNKKEPKPWKVSEINPNYVVLGEDIKEFDKAVTAHAKKIKAKSTIPARASSETVSKHIQYLQQREEFAHLLDTDPEFRKKVFEDNCGVDIHTQDIWDEVRNEVDKYDPKYRALMEKYPDATLEDLCTDETLWNAYIESGKDRKKRYEKEGIDPEISPMTREELYTALSEGVSDETFKPIRDAFPDAYDKGGGFNYTGKGWPKSANVKKSIEKWRNNPIDPSPFLKDPRLVIYVEDLAKYLDENYPEKKPGDSFTKVKMPEIVKDSIEKVIEENPKEAEIALKSMGQDELATEAKQVSTPDKRDDEVNDKVIAEAIDPPKVTEEAVKPLSEGYEDGMRKRTEEQQAEFDRIKAESDKAAEEWRKQQFNKPMDNGAQEASETSTNPSTTSGQSDSGEQRPEISIDDVNEEMKRFSGSKKRKGKGSIEELEALEFNPEEFNKQYEAQYGSKKPEEAIKEELSEDEKNDMEYKPSEEELKALHDANKAEWEANGRPKKKDVLDQDIKIDPDLMQKMVDDQLKEETEKAIEEDPERAEEAAEKSLGEGNPIEEEAEQANDQSNKRDDEVNDDSLNNLEDDMAFLDEYNGEGAEFDANDDPNSLLSRNQRYAQELNAPERPLDSVVDYGLEDRNVYPDKPHDWSKRQKMVNEKYNEDFEPNYNPEERPDFNVDDTVIDKKAKKLPDLEIEEIPHEELERIFAPLNKEIEGLNSQLKSAEDALELAQRHFDENPDEKNAAALNAANQKYQDVQYILNKRQDEYAEAYENMANLYQPKVEEEEEQPYFIKEVEEEERTPFNMKGTNINFGGSSTVTPNTPHMEERSGSAGGIGSKMVPMHALGSASITPGSVGGGMNITPEPKQMQQGRGGSASITPPANTSSPRGFGSSNDAPHSNGTTSSGAVNYTPKSTNYAAPVSTAPKLAMLGHTAQSGMGGEVPSLGLLGRNVNPKELLIAQLEAALNQLSMKNPELVAKLGFGHKYKHWDYNDITLEELSPNDLNDLLKKVQSLN